MFFSNAVILSAIATLAAAQSSVLTFTHVPNPITDGQAQAITYATNDTAGPVTIILRKGDSTNLQTVQTLTSSAIGGQYVWTPSENLPNGVDYALQITQGTQTNYFGPFSIQGASSSASIVGYGSSSSRMSASSNVTTTTAIAVIPGTISAGTGTALPRNTTMTMASLTSSASSTPATVSATSTSSGAGFQSATGSASASASGNAGSASFQVGSSMALLGAIAAAVLVQ
ncbi:hypothetical protein B0A48_08889 [Cryoendolithus antarcticus]|uniref:Yeast cell wall synthesis Kre9/Knh1-like N-terminal domain-containing protein n=1 Tax=Cryoendolithus antarcticus TaxID=1507870 RepID=A0A1V8T4M0_9PEZI|nr:hypothetical protein B0A48_08889 [Cryoendolithus antarcticus]